jgi:signal transduction histidine kinase
MASKPKTLRRRMIVSIALMLLGSLTIGIGAMIAINSLHQDLGSAVQGYRQLRQLFDVGFVASKARDAITADPPQPQRAIAALQAALVDLNEQSNANAIEGPPAKWTDESARDDCRVLLSNAIREISHGSQSAPSLNLLFARMSKISDDVRNSIAATQTAADHKQRLALWTIIALCAAVVLGAVAIGMRQYHRVIHPLQSIGQGARGFAKGEFATRISLTGDQEFLALANDFNHMADELTALYRELEQKVAAKSKELVQSERLASVGYLAAGVAHEINNPLGIIAGYGERAIQQLANGLDETSLPRTQKALAVICEEAFRCKQITDRLLSLARPGSQTRSIVSVAAIAQEIVTTLSGLGTVGDRRLSLNINPQIDFSVLADAGELKQVFLNLIINALEAVDPATGQVRIHISRSGDDIQLEVADNGTGMTPETLDRIFQPFYTEKRGQRAGTGLGLSIAHTLVTNHGGRITAHSAGPNRGSTFLVQLPAAGSEVIDAAH